MRIDTFKISLTLLAASLAFSSSFCCSVGAANAAPAKKVIAVKSPVWARGIKTPYRSWIPVNKPQEVLLCVHGLGFSSASFSQFGRVMAGHGFAVYALDVRGFGEWMHRKGEAQVDFEACLSDVEAALRVLRKTYPGVPIVMVGESMGGAIALAASSRHPDLVDALISCVPSSDRYAKTSSELVIGAHYLADADKPVDMTPEVVDRITDDPALRAKMESEPLNRMKITPKELKQFESFMKGNNDAAKLVEKMPVLMLAGFKDKLVKPEGTIELFNDLSTPDKLLLIVGDGEHLLLEENQLKHQLALLLTDWIRTEGTAHKPAR
ncbi:MAG: alpha/beta fold hydrolase [Cyanobacteria bacterium SZAS LIN-2]|nr:alpha/beta fold hydrolase [Cyanobacteria bacterium SZAS LIN-2]